MKQAIKYIFLFAIASAFLLLVTQCATERQRTKICATCPVIVKDSIHTIVQPFDTTLFITKYGQDINLKIGAEYEKFGHEWNALFKKYNDTITTLKNGIKTQIIKLPGQIKFKCAADSLMYLLTLERSKTVKTKTITVTVPKTCPECNREHRTGWDYFCRWIVYFLMLIIGIKYLPAIFKSIKNFR